MQIFLLLNMWIVVNKKADRQNVKEEQDEKIKCKIAGIRSGSMQRAQ